jgi:putative transposase
LVTAHHLSVVRACQVAQLSRAAYYRPPPPRLDRDAPVIAALHRLVAGAGARWGCDKLADRLRAVGHPWNPKRIRRVYRILGLTHRRRTKRRVPTRPKQPLDAPAELNRTWALDFMHDRLYDGRPFRTLNVLDEGNREALAIEVGTSLPSRRVTALLDQLVAVHGRPAALRLDNGPELIAQELVDWCAAQQVRLGHIQPGKPNQNAYMERFNRTNRTEVLDAWLFISLDEARATTDAWIRTYNTERPHDSLGGVPPLHFIPKPTSCPESGYQLST